MENKENYTFLKKSTLIIKVLASIFAGLGIVGALIILFGKTEGSGKLASLGVLFMGGLYFIILYLVADVIRLLVDLLNRVAKIETTLSTTKKEIR